MSEIHLPPLFEHQKRAIEFFPRIRYLAWDVGCGKTRAALAIANKYGLKKLLVVAPKSAEMSWRTELKWFPGIDLRTTTYESFRDKIQPEDLWGFDMVIFDEAHRLSNPATQWTRKALLSRRYMKEVLMLSGTPADKWHKIYSQLRILDPRDSFFRRYPRYRDFLNEFFVLDEYFKPVKIIKGKEREILDWFHSKAYVVRVDEVVELPPLYRIRKELPFEKSLSLRNITDATNFMSVYAESANLKIKIDYVAELIEEKQNVLVFSYTKDFVKELKKKFKDKIYAILGESGSDDLNRAVSLQDKPIVSTYKLKEGANLQGYNLVVYASLPLGYVDYEQSLGRVYRVGQKTKVVALHLIASEIDEFVYRLINQKKHVLEMFKKGNPFLNNLPDLRFWT